MNARTRKTSGFTLVEILIVVIILGILAAIVIPQFTNASQDARKNSLTSQLQTLRSQIELYKLQHLDENPPDIDAPGLVQHTAAWSKFIVKTNADHTTSGGTLRFGPYLQTYPMNPVSDQGTDDASDVFVVAADVTAGGASGAGSAGWVFNHLNGKLWATSKTGTNVYDEANPENSLNDQ